VTVCPASQFDSLTAGERVFLMWDDATLTESVTVTHRPVADAGADRAVPCCGGTLVRLDGTGSYDPDGDAFTMRWLVPSGTVLDDATSPTPQGAFPLGATSATLIVTDEHGAVHSDDVVITVFDDAPPQLVCTTDKASLKPANHEMVAVEVHVEGTDACSAPDELRLVMVTLASSEPDDARDKSDGSTTGDTHGADGYSAPVDVGYEFAYNAETARFEGTVLLRAECDTKGSGRSYSIRATIVDAAGNLAETTCVVAVPVEDKAADGTGGKVKGRKK
jgi:hypothetical protein